MLSYQVLSSDEGLECSYQEVSNPHRFSSKTNNKIKNKIFIFYHSHLWPFILAILTRNPRVGDCWLTLVWVPSPFVWVPSPSSPLFTTKKCITIPMKICKANLKNLVELWCFRWKVCRRKNNRWNLLSNVLFLRSMHLEINFFFLSKLRTEKFIFKENFDEPNRKIIFFWKITKTIEFYKYLLKQHFPLRFKSTIVTIFLERKFHFQFFVKQQNWVALTFPKAMFQNNFDPWQLTAQWWHLHAGISKINTKKSTN